MRTWKLKRPVVANCLRRSNLVSCHFFCLFFIFFPLFTPSLAYGNKPWSWRWPGFALCHDFMLSPLNHYLLNSSFILFLRCPFFLKPFVPPNSKPKPKKQRKNEKLRIKMFLSSFFLPRSASLIHQRLRSCFLRTTLSLLFHFNSSYYWSMICPSTSMYIQFPALTKGLLFLQDTLAWSSRPRLAS